MRILLLVFALMQDPDPMRPFIDEAIKHNLSLAQQRLAMEKSDAARDQARGVFLPSVSVDTRYSETRGGLTIPGVGSYPFAQESRMRFVQPIFQPAVLANYKLHSSLRGLEGAKLRTATRSLAADVQLGYMSYARAHRVVDLYSNTLALTREAVRVNEKLLANGKITPAALHRAIADRSDIEQQLAQAEQQRNAAARYFNYLLGRDTQLPVELIADSLLIRPLAVTLEQALSSSLTAREELEQADFGIRAAEAQSRLAKSSYLPGVSLAIDYGIQGDSYRFDRDHDAGMASLVLSWNLFNGGQDNARRQQADIEVQRGRVGRKQAEQQIELQVRQAYDGVVVSRKAIDAAQDRVTAARRSFDLMRRRYTEGVASQLEFLDARTALTNAELNWILTNYAYVANYIELERAAALRTFQ